jgi:MFS family permease
MSSTLLSPAAAGELSPRRKSLVLAVCCVSIVVVVMDISIVNVVLPEMGRDLHASESGLQWTVDAYTLVLAGFLVLAGSTADRVGRRLVFQAGLAVFGLGSLLCGLAPGTGWLVAARVLQAVGGTMLNPEAGWPAPSAGGRSSGSTSQSWRRRSYALRCSCPSPVPPGRAGSTRSGRC